MKQYNHRMSKILLIEDDPDDVDLIKRAISDSSLKVQLDVVDNGEDALKYLGNIGGEINQPLPDIVLLDLNLPRVSGQEVLRSIRNNHNLNHLIVIVLTTSTAQEHVDQCYQLNANCYLSKPVSMSKYTELIKNVYDFWVVSGRLPSS